MDTCTIPVVEETAPLIEDTKSPASWRISTERETWTLLSSGLLFEGSNEDTSPPVSLEGLCTSIATTFEISPQQLGDWSSDRNIAYSHYLMPPPHYTVDTALAQQQFRTLLEAYPRAIPVLKTAFLSGRIDGGTYGHVYTTSACCVLGWVGKVYPQTKYIQDITFGPYAMLERYVRDIVPGQTPETSPILATLLSFIEQVEEEQRSVEEVYSLTTQVLDEYPLVCPYYLRAAEEGLFAMLSYTLTPTGRMCVVGWVALAYDWQMQYAANPPFPLYESAIVLWRGEGTPLDRLESILSRFVVVGQTVATNPYLYALRQACLDYKKNRQALLIVPERTLALCHS